MKNKSKKIYTSPFENLCSNQVFCGPEGNKHAFDFDKKVTAVQKSKIIKILNGENLKILKFKPELLKNTYDSFITYKDEKFISIRGWGYLTGLLKISEEKAVKIQDDFAEWIINRLVESQK